MTFRIEQLWLAEQMQSAHGSQPLWTHVLLTDEFNTFLLGCLAPRRDGTLTPLARID